MYYYTIQISKFFLSPSIRVNVSDHAPKKRMPLVGGILKSFLSPSQAQKAIKLAKASDFPFPQALLPCTSTS